MQLRQLFLLEKHYIPFASEQQDYSNLFRVVPKAQETLANGLIQSLIVLSQDQECVQLTVKQIKNAVLEKSVQEQGTKKLLAFIKKKFNEKIQSYQAQQAKYPDSCIIVFTHFDALNIKNVNFVAKLIAKYDQMINNIKLLVNFPTHYMHRDELKICFGTYQALYLQNYDTSVKYQVFRSIQEQIQYEPYEKKLKNKVQESFDLISSLEALIRISLDIQNLPLLTLVVPFLKHRIDKHNMTPNLVTRYCVYQMFIKKYCALNLLLATDAGQLQLISSLQDNQSQGNRQKLLQLVCQLHQIISWKMLRYQSDSLSQAQMEEVFNEFDCKFTIDGAKKTATYLLNFTPTTTNSKGELSYSCKSLYQFFIAQSIFEATLSTQSTSLDANNTILNTSYLSYDTNIIVFVGEHLMQVPLQLQYQLFYDIWYQSVLLSRQLFNVPTMEASVSSNLKHLASNCISLLASTPLCDLRDRDFSKCAIPNAYLCDRDFTKSNFAICDLQNCNFDGSILNYCTFDESVLINAHFRKSFRIMDQYSSLINVIQISPDKKIIAFNNILNNILLYDLCSKKLIARFIAQNHQVIFLQFSSDSKILLAGSNDSVLKLWNIQNKKQIFSIKFDLGLSYSFAYLPKLNLVTYCGKNTTIIVWDLQNQTKIFQKYMQPHQINSVTFSPDGFFLATANTANLFQLWNLKNSEEEIRFKGHTGAVSQIVFSPDCKILASGYDDGTVTLWDLKSLRIIQTLKSHQGPIRSVLFSPNARILLSGGLDSTVNLWDMQNYTKINSFVSDCRFAQSVAFSSDTLLFANSIQSRRIQVRKLKAFKENNFTKNHSNWVFAVAFSPNCKMLASAGADHSIKLWNTQSLTQIISLEGHTRWIKSVAFSKDSKLLASGGCDKVIILWNLQTFSQIKTFAGHLLPICSVIFLPEKLSLISCSGDNTIRVWDVHTGQQIMVMKGHKNWVKQVVLSNDYKILASASADTTVRLWDTKDWKQVGILSGHEKAVLAVAISSDSQMLASGSLDNTVRLWSVETRALIFVFEGNSNAVSAVDFSADCKILVSGSSSSKVRLWDVKKRLLIAEFQQHEGEVMSLVFSADAKMLASGSMDNSVRVWYMSDLIGEQKEQITTDQQVVPHSDNSIVDGKDKYQQFWDIQKFAQSYEDKKYIQNSDCYINEPKFKFKKMWKHYLR